MGCTGLIRFYKYFQFSCHHIYYRKGKEIENFKFSMLKFTISVSNLYMKPIWTTFELLPVITIIWNYPHLFPGHQSWLIFSQNLKNGEFCRPTDFADHVIVTPFSMFKDNFAQFFRKTRYELIKTTYF